MTDWRGPTESPRAIVMYVMRKRLRCIEGSVNVERGACRKEAGEQCNREADCALIDHHVYGCCRRTPSCHSLLKLQTMKPMIVRLGA